MRFSTRTLYALLPFFATSTLLVACIGSNEDFKLTRAVSLKSTNAPIPPDSSTLPPLPLPAIPIPDLALWEANMISAAAPNGSGAPGGAAYWCRDDQLVALENMLYSAAINNGAPNESAFWYYDGARVAYQIAQYTGNATFTACGNRANAAYRNFVITRSNDASSTRIVQKAMTGWRIFPHGLIQNFRATGDVQSKEAVIDLATESAYLHTWGDVYGGPAGPGFGQTCDLSRENAYMINAMLGAIEVGQSEDPRLILAINAAIGHLEGWYGTPRRADCLRTSPGESGIKPFMTGLVMEALIWAYEVKNDSVLRARIQTAIELAANQLWAVAWIPTQTSFYYYESDPTSGAPALNNLIGHAYGWLWQRTGNAQYRDRGDQIFSGAAKNPQVYGGKQFSQLYRLSFNYVKWRSLPVNTAIVPTRY